MKLNVTKYFEQTAVITVYRLHDSLVDKYLCCSYIYTLNLVFFIFIFTSLQLFIFHLFKKFLRLMLPLTTCGFFSRDTDRNQAEH